MSSQPNSDTDVVIQAEAFLEPAKDTAPPSMPSTNLPEAVSIP